MGLINIQVHDIKFSSHSFFHETITIKSNILHAQALRIFTREDIWRDTGNFKKYGKTSSRHEDHTNLHIDSVQYSADGIVKLGNCQ